MGEEITKREFRRHLKKIAGIVHKECTIYQIKHPLTSEIVYIGQSFNLEQRIHSHFYQNSNPAKLKWFTSLRKQGLFPIVEVLEILPENSWDYLHKENHHIKLALKKGANLFNIKTELTPSQLF